MADSTYQVMDIDRWGLTALAVAASLGALGAGLAGKVEGVWLCLGVAAVLGLAAWRRLVRWPHQVTLTEAGVWFSTTTRRTFLPWTDLAAITRTSFRKNTYLQWRHRTTTEVTVTSAGFLLHPRLMDEVRWRAPHVQVLL